MYFYQVFHLRLLIWNWNRKKGNMPTANSCVLYFSGKFPLVAEMFHSLDIWHKAKKLTKALHQVNMVAIWNYAFNEMKCSLQICLGKAVVKGSQS